MTDLVDIIKKQNDKEGVERILKYRDFRDLLKGEHRDLFLRFDTTRNAINDPYICVNLPALISRKQADLLFLNKLKITTNNEKTNTKLNAILNKNEFQKTCYKQAITASSLGGCFFRVRYGAMNKYLTNEQNEIIIDALSPNNVFPEIQNNKIVACTIKYIETEVKVNHKGTTKEEYYIEEHYEPYKYTKSTYLIKRSRKGVETVLLDKPLEIDLPFSFIPVIYIPNALESGFYGVSDFDDKLELIHEINNSLSRLSSAIRRYTYPILVATEEWIKKAKAQGQAFTSVKSPSYHIRPTGEQIKIKVEDIGVTAAPRDRDGKFQDVFKFIEYTPDLSAIHKHLDKCERLLLKLCGISPALLENNENLSGEALKLKLTNTLVMISAKKALWEEGIRQLVNIVLTMDRIYSGDKPLSNKFDSIEETHEISVEWGDTMPTLTSIKLKTVIDKVNAGLMSKKRAIKILENLNDKDAEAELNQINNELNN